MTFSEVIQISTLIADVVKVIIPFGFILYILHKFEKELRTLINNGGWKISAPGVLIESLQKQQETLGEKNEEKVEILKKEVESAQKREEKLLQLQEFTSKDKDTFLLGYHFEKVYRLIFPSQMVILNALNNTNGIDEALAIAIHRRTIWARDFNTTYEQFMKFLIQNGLIEIRENKLYITHLGITFMDYLIKNNISLKLPANDQISEPTVNT